MGINTRFDMILQMSLGTHLSDISDRVCWLRIRSFALGFFLISESIDRVFMSTYRSINDLGFSIAATKCTLADLQTNLNDQHGWKKVCIVYQES